MNASMERESLARLLGAEWTRFRRGRGWMIGTGIAWLLTLVLGMLLIAAVHSTCTGPCGALTLGPDGEAVTDTFSFVHVPLTGDGAITARVTSMNGLITYPPSHPHDIIPGVVPWAKAGVIVEDGTAQGSPYAAVMATGDHGVRMQYDYVHDIAGLPGRASAAAPRWLRLERSGDTLRGYDSADGRRWARLGETTLAGLPRTVEIGLFVASPQFAFAAHGGSEAHLTQATATFDRVGLRGETGGAPWREASVGFTPGGPPLARGGFSESQGAFTVRGSGDLAPRVGGALPLEDTLIGTFAGLLAMIVVGVGFGRAPASGRALAAKALVVGPAGVAAGLAAAAIALPLGEWLLGAEGLPVLPVPLLDQVRMVAGTGGLLGVTGVLAVGVVAILRRAVLAMPIVAATTVLPYLAGLTGLLPAGAAVGLVSVTPAAGFAVQQSLPWYPQVEVPSWPFSGYFPLAPAAGFAVLCAYAALALALAAVRVRGGTGDA